jgi:hypothetical protein
MSVSINGTSGLVFNDASTQNTAATGFGFKNRIINGAMMIDQRNAGASVTVTDTSNLTYTLDRWSAFGSAASKFSIQQDAGAVTPPAGFTDYLGVTSLAATSVGTSDQYTVGQIIEGFNIADLGWGTANAQPVTLSFWVRSSLTGTFGGAIVNSGFARGYGFTYVINAANTWEQKSVTIAGDTTGTWLTTNGIGINVRFGLGVGSTLSAPVGSWSAGSYRSAVGATSVVGTSGATFYITGVQLEKGSTATSFDYRPYGTEMSLCQRYYTKTYSDANVPGSTVSGQQQANSIWSSVPTTNSYPQIGQWFYPVTMRATPTIVIYNPNTGTVNGFRGDSDNFSPASTNSIGNKCVSFYGNGTSVGTSVFISVQATASAEL